MEAPKISKIIKKGVWNSQKKVYYLNKIADNKVTIIVCKASAYENIDEGAVTIATESIMGESITLKVAKETIDEVIENYGDIVAKIYHNNGILTGIQTFEKMEKSKGEVENEK